jgi:hypothetical protein
MALSYPTYQTSIDLTLKETETGNPLPNKDVRIYFHTQASEELLGGRPYDVDTIVTTDSNGVIDTIITHHGAIQGDVKARFAGGGEYNPATINVTATSWLWKPELNGETGADYVWSYSEANGECVGKGFVFKNGFKNIDKWELSFEFRHDNIRYTGICFLAKLGEYNGGGGDSSVALTTWEGTWPNGEKYFTGNVYSGGTIDWFDVKVTKIDPTHVRLQSTTLNRDTTVEVTWLPTVRRLTFGARHNYAPTNSETMNYGPSRIRNIQVIPSS